jgi:uncharacterized protein YyaL (SSP411 family)
MFWPLLLLSMVLAAPAAALENQLRDHASPYLAMHGDDPVAWQDWGAEAVALARSEGKLLLVSSGYFSCHWCHVMQRESYQDEAIAALLNRHFVPVKLDRELHGALDAFLIDFVEQTQGHAGWPLNVFLTPEGYPLIGATYLPPDRFRELLRRLNGRWAGEPDRLRDLARRTLRQLMPDETATRVEPLPAAALRDALFVEAIGIADVMEGGFGDQNKFPMAPQLLALLELQAASPRPQLAEFLTLTLDRMAAGGLRDHLAGGFFRYTIDPSWQVPHFEKMLYTQALLSEVYRQAAGLFGRADYAAVARETLDFVMREMAGPQGGYVASFSAVDGAGREGAVYLWAADELDALLGEPDSKLARRHWQLADPPLLDGGNLPRQGETVGQIATATGMTAAETGRRLAAIRGRLLAARAKRTLPVDDKELAGWNGLMLTAFARAALTWDDPELRAAATRIRDFLGSRLWNGRELRRALAGGRALGKASLEDYAYAADGLAAYAELSKDPTDRALVLALLDAAWQRFYRDGGWRSDDRPLIPGMTERPALPEGALPAPSAVLIRVAARSGETALVERARSAAERGRRQAQQQPFWYAGHHAVLLADPVAQRPERRPSGDTRGGSDAAPVPAAGGQ